MDQYVATGKAKLEYKHRIIIDGNVGGSESRDTAEASECAAEQGQFWPYEAIVFANYQGEGSGSYSVRRLKAFAETIGLDMNAFNSCLSSGRPAAAVRADDQAATQIGVNSTPTVFINGVQIQNPNDFNEIQRVVEAHLQQQ